MQWIYALSWMWQALGICLTAVAVCLVCAAVICRLRGKHLEKRVILLLSIVALLVAVFFILQLAQTPMPI